MLPPISKPYCEKCKDFDEILSLIKDKMQSTSKKQCVQLLTLAPSTWRIEKTKSYFGVTTYMVKEVRKLKPEEGILSELPAKCEEASRMIPLK